MNAAERAKKREKQRARIMGRGPLGFSRKTWPFVKVLVGTWIFSLGYYVGVKQVVTWRPDFWDVGERLALMIQCSILSLVPAVVAIADDEAGVVIHAHLSLVEGDKISLIKLKKFCSERLPVYMVPDKFQFHPSLPKTSTDKIDYQRLKAEG